MSEENTKCENCQLRNVNDSKNILDSHLTEIRIKLIRIRTEHLATLLKLGFFPFLSPKQSLYRGILQTVVYSVQYSITAYGDILQFIHAFFMDIFYYQEQSYRGVHCTVLYCRYFLSLYCIVSTYLSSLLIPCLQNNTLLHSALYQTTF